MSYWKHHTVLREEEYKVVKCSAIKYWSGFNPTKKGKELMTKGITPSCRKHVLAFPKEKVTRRLWLSAFHRNADSFNPEHSGVCELQFKAEDFEANCAPRILALLMYGCVSNLIKAVPSILGNVQ